MCVSQSLFRRKIKTDCILSWHIDLVHACTIIKVVNISLFVLLLLGGKQSNVLLMCINVATLSICRSKMLSLPSLFVCFFHPFFTLINNHHITNSNIKIFAQNQLSQQNKIFSFYSKCVISFVPLRRSQLFIKCWCKYFFNITCTIVNRLKMKFYDLLSMKPEIFSPLI